jgi:hypothetical protein
MGKESTNQLKTNQRKYFIEKETMFLETMTVITKCGGLK